MFDFISLLAAELGKPKFGISGKGLTLNSTDTHCNASTTTCHQQHVSNFFFSKKESTQ